MAVLLYMCICVNTRMRICVTCPSDNPDIDQIFGFCQQQGIPMFPSSYIHVGDSYWIWRIEAEPSPDLTWLLLRYGQYLTVF